MSEHSIRVLEILPGNRAIVSTEGFCRIVWRNNGSLYGEFFDLPTAHLLTADGPELDAISYPTGQTLRFHNEGLSNDACTRYDQLMNARTFGGPKRSKVWRTKRKNRIKGFRRGRLLNPEVMAAVVPVEGGAN